MKRWIHTSIDVNEQYVEIPEGHKITLQRSRGPLTVMSYGEGWENGYHVEHTDYAGGKFVDDGIVDGYTIGDKVLWKYASSDIGRPEEVTIKMAHIYPNGKVEYTVVDEAGDGHSAAKETLDKYNK